MRKLGILFVAGLLVAATCLPAMAQSEWAFYGSVRFWTGWEQDNLGTTGGFGAGGLTGRSAAYNYVAATNLSTAEGDGDLYWGQQNNSRFGARVKAGAVGAQVEYGTDATEGSPGADKPRIRVMSATWNFGPGTLLIGQDYTPFFWPITDMCGPSGGDCSGIGFGTPYPGRLDQVTLRFGGFQLGFIEPNTTLPSAQPSGTAVAAAADTDRTIPKIEASYSGAFGPVAFFVGGGYNAMKGNWNAAGFGYREIKVDSYVGAAGAKVTFGPFYLNGIFMLGQNVGNYGQITTISNTGAALNQAALSATTDVVDSDYWCGMIVAGFKVSDMLRFEAGFSRQEVEQDDIIANAGKQWSFSTDAYFVMAIISPAKNVFIIPEMGRVDYNKREYTGIADLPLGDSTWIGIKWQINF